MPSSPAAAISEIDQSSDSWRVGVGVATKLVVGSGVGLAVVLGLGVGTGVGSGVPGGNVGFMLGIGELAGPGGKVAVVAGVGEAAGEIWAGLLLQPAATITASVTNSRNDIALKIPQTLLATSAATCVLLPSTHAIHCITSLLRPIIPLGGTLARLVDQRYPRDLSLFIPFVLLDQSARIKFRGTSPV